MKTLKNPLLLFMLLICLSALAACKSDEDKVSETIEKYLKENVKDMETYTPVKTDISEAKNTIDNNPDIQKLADNLTIVSVGMTLGVVSKADALSEIESLRNQIYNKGSKLDQDETIGWLVVQKYKYKIKYEKEKETERRFILSPDFKKVLHTDNSELFENEMFNSIGKYTKELLLKSIKDELDNTIVVEPMDEDDSYDTISYDTIPY